MKKRREIKIGVASAKSSAREFVEVYRRAEKGRGLKEASERIFFSDLETLMRTLTDKRLEILRVLHQTGPMSVRALAQQIGRDYKNVHGDIQILKRIGLLEADPKGGISVPWDRIAAEISLAA